MAANVMPVQRGQNAPDGNWRLLDAFAAGKHQWCADQMQIGRIRGKVLADVGRQIRKCGQHAFIHQHQTTAACRKSITGKRGMQRPIPWGEQSACEHDREFVSDCNFLQMKRHSGILHRGSAYRNHSQTINMQAPDKGAGFNTAPLLMARVQAPDFQESLSVTVRLNTGAPGRLSGSA